MTDHMEKVLREQRYEAAQLKDRPFRKSTKLVMQGVPNRTMRRSLIPNVKQSMQTKEEPRHPQQPPVQPRIPPQQAPPPPQPTSHSISSSAKENIPFPVEIVVTQFSLRSRNSGSRTKPWQSPPRRDGASSSTPMDQFLVSPLRHQEDEDDDGASSSLHEEEEYSQNVRTLATEYGSI